MKIYNNIKNSTICPILLNNGSQTIPQLNSYKNIFQRTPSADSFEKTVSFKSQNDDNSFISFAKWAEETDFLSKAKEIAEKTGKILGSGFEGTTYSIPECDKWVIKEFKRSNLIRVNGETKRIIQIKDILPELNAGQAIARVEVPNGPRFVSQYFILKRQNGVSHGITYKYSNDIDEINIKAHLKSLKVLAELPQESFDKCIKDITYITNQGYQIDFLNPYNLMIDNKAKSINFVDINDRLNRNSNQYAEVLYSLLDAAFGEKIIAVPESKASAESASLTRIIVEKYFTAMKNNNAKFSSDFLLTLLETKLLDGNLKGNNTEEKMLDLHRKNLI